MRRTTSICLIAATAIMIATGLSGCGTGTITTPASALASPSAVATPSADGSSAPAQPAPTDTAVKTIDLNNPGHNGVTTAIDTITCKGEPVSGIYVEGPNGSNKAPLGDQEIGDNTAATLKLMHDIPAGTKTYVVNIGCGYAGDMSDHNWLHRYENLPAVATGTPHTFVCSGTDGCAIDGKS